MPPIIGSLPSQLKLKSGNPVTAGDHAAASYSRGDDENAIRNCRYAPAPLRCHRRFAAGRAPLPRAAAGALREA